MITSIQAIQKLTNDIISLIQSGKLNATYHQSKHTVSFYVNDIDTGAQKRLTLRVSDHHPTLQRYVKKNNDLPNHTNNLSIEFYKPVYLSSGKRKPNKTNRRVRVPSWATKLSDFSVSIYNYKPQYLDPVDITTIYNAILKWFSDTTNNPDAKYIDPFKGTPKAATTSAPISKLRENKQYRDMKQKQVIKLNESQLRCMIKKMIMEGLYNDYSGNDLNYDSIKMQADSCIANMISNGEEISWKEVAKNMGFRLETLNYDDLELMKSAIEDAMLEDEKINENSNKMKQKLSESQLRKIIKESIKKVLNESSYDSEHNFNREGHNADLQQRFIDVFQKVRIEMDDAIQTLSYISTAVVDDDILQTRVQKTKNALLEAIRETNIIANRIYQNRWDLTDDIVDNEY